MGLKDLFGKNSSGSLETHPDFVKASYQMPWDHGPGKQEIEALEAASQIPELETTAEAPVEGAGERYIQSLLQGSLGF